MNAHGISRRAVVGAAAAVACGAVLAQGASDWPKRQPIRIVSVFPPGGSVDQVARILAQQLGQQVGQNVIVENRVGASGSIGTASIAASAPDGYTLGVVFDTHGVNPSLIPNLPYDTRRDLVPLLLVGTSPMVLATSAGSEYKTFADVVAAAKAKKAVNFGSVGNGSLGHLAMALLEREIGAPMTHVPYKGGGPLMQDAVAGHVPLSIATVFVTKPHIDSKRMRPLVVTTSKRSGTLPDVPTIAESGFSGFEAPAWWGVIGSSKIPPDIVARLNDELNKALKNPEVAKKLEGQGIDIAGGSVDSARAFIDRQIETWARVVKENGIKAD